MLRGFAVSALAVLLAGCASTSDYYAYDDGYYVDDREPVYVGGSSYYTPARERHGDYYYGSASYGYGWSSSAYLDYPYYYSLFHPWQRWTVDPYWHPGFYYGVTYYPRSYFSIGFGGSYAYGASYYRPHYGYFAYSPYRLAWVDHYYDWSPWYDRSPSYNHRWYAPRYGNARHETDWLSRQARYDSHAGRGDSRRWWDREGLPNTRAQRYEDRSRGAVADRREALRGADYGGRSVPRQDPQVSGFGYRREAEVKRPSDLRTPIGTQRGSRGADVRGETSRERASREGRYIGDSGDVRQLPARSEAGRPGRAATRGDGRVVEAAPRGRLDREAYRVDSPRGTPGDRQRPVSRYEPAPVREAPAYRSTSPRRDVREGGYDVRQRTAEQRPLVGERPSSRGYGGYPIGRDDATRQRYSASRDGETRYAEPRQQTSRPRQEAPVQRYQAPASRDYGQPRQTYAPREPAMRQAPAYQAPARGSYEASSRGSYEAPSRGSYEAPSRGSNEAPSRGSYEAPSRGSYEAPARSSYAEPRQARSESSRAADSGERRGGEGRGRAVTRDDDR